MKKLSGEQVEELAAEGATKSAELVTKAHLSLTGASGKVGLYLDNGGDWYLPHGSAPSTHIVKQSHVRLDGIVTNEQLSLMTARRCGLPIPHSFIIDTGRGEDEAILLATRRYDRVFDGSMRRIDGMACPLRLHQEDFAQAMGIPSSEKHERETGNYLKGMFDILRKHSADPITDQLRLWDCVVFHYLIGNTDAHIKNFSLLYTPDLATVRLAPFYDIVSTTVYESSTRDMAFQIGGARSIDEITEASFRDAAKEAGLGENMAMKRYADMCGRFESALHRSAEELEHMGYAKAADIAERILQTGGCRKI